MKNTITITLLLLTFYTAQAYTTFPIILSDTTQVSNKSELYEMYQDKEYVYFTVNTGDPKMMMSMLRQGVIIYYDIKGKKKRNVAVTYPVRGDQPNRERRERPVGQENRGESAPDGDRLYAMIRNRIEKGLPQEATYMFFKELITFNVQLNSEDIGVGFVFDSENQLLTYHVKMPKSKISNDPQTDFSKLTIGVKTPERTTNNREGGNRQNARGGGGSGQRGGGGPPGVGGGRGGQRGGGQQRPSQQQSAAALDFWFKAGL